jgi:hypothetical protein
MLSALQKLHEVVTVIVIIPVLQVMKIWFRAAVELAAKLSMETKLVRNSSMFVHITLLGFKIM